MGIKIRKSSSIHHHNFKFNNLLQKSSTDPKRSCAKPCDQLFDVVLSFFFLLPFAFSKVIPKDSGQW